MNGDTATGGQPFWNEQAHSHFSFANTQNGPPHGQMSEPTTVVAGSGPNVSAWNSHGRGVDNHQAGPGSGSTWRLNNRSVSHSQQVQAHHSQTQPQTQPQLHHGHTSQAGAARPASPAPTVTAAAVVAGTSGNNGLYTSAGRTSKPPNLNLHQRGQTAEVAQLGLTPTVVSSGPPVSAHGVIGSALSSSSSGAPGSFRDSVGSSSSGNWSATSSSSDDAHGNGGHSNEHSSLLMKLKDDTAPRSGYHHHHHHHHHPIPPRPDDLKSATTTFGLIGLVNQMQTADADSNMLLYGDDENEDPSTASLSMEPGISAALHTPWVDPSAARELEHNWPHIKHYMVNPASIETTLKRLNHVGDSALFYTFYTCPRDIRQVTAARQLQARNWRYHRKIGRWITKDQQVHVTDEYEKGIFVVFDPASWNKTHQELTVYADDLE